MTLNALVVRGGWEGHRPVEATDMFIPFLERAGYQVRVEASPTCTRTRTRWPPPTSCCSA
ncbi:hypothetical protein [Phytohabitans houttuyneae]|uniref:DJ-1/PfpI domain-containing protein n=1 Tax=Phytohabitans houttuyneae TaxID=1076126 RepID=A0A6V8KJW3_9ACTN|nr:hypothetical protein [Phytohabitans houttuyneae]GFJ82711.1 hypothetical protein Phou_068910 [Phytohabitans houttuyneae]